MGMKLSCFFGMHDWRDLPRFKCRDYHDQWTNPTKICRRCFKQWRQRVALHVGSIEGPGLGWHMPPFWEGQSPPACCESWTEHRKCRDTALKNLLERAK